VFSRGNILERFTVKLSPVGDTAYHRTDVNKVEVVVGVSPFICDIVNLESAVGGYEVWLDGRKIDAKNVSRRMLISEFTAFVSLDIREGLHLCELTLPKYQFRILCQELSAPQLEDALMFWGCCLPEDCLQWVPHTANCQG
jgi:hypothetical protein